MLPDPNGVLPGKSRPKVVIPCQRDRGFAGETVRVFAGGLKMREESMEKPRNIIRTNVLESTYKTSHVSHASQKSDESYRSDRSGSGAGRVRTPTPSKGRQGRGKITFIALIR